MRGPLIPLPVRWCRKGRHSKQVDQEPTPMSPGEKSMYAVIKSGGKQYRVQEGQTLKLEKIEVPTGESIDFDEVLLVGNDDEVKVGAPLVEGAKVSAEIVSHGRGEIGRASCRERV